MTNAMSVRPDHPVGPAGQMRPAEAAELDRVEGGEWPTEGGSWPRPSDTWYDLNVTARMVTQARQVMTAALKAAGAL